MEEWVKDVTDHSSYSCLCCIHPWPIQSLVIHVPIQTIPDIQDLFHPLETAIHHLIPALIGRDTCSTLEQDLLALQYG